MTKKLLDLANELEKYHLKVEVRAGMYTLVDPNPDKRANFPTEKLAKRAKRHLGDQVETSQYFFDRMWKFDRIKKEELFDVCTFKWPHD